MPENRPILGYALNVFPAETLADLWACLENEVLQIKERVFPSEPFPIELRFSEKIVRDLDCDQVARLKYFLDTHDLTLVTVNAFVIPHFHGQRVKEQVYLPAWHESDARLNFTNTCVDILSQLAPGASLSVPFGAIKPVTMEQVAPNILRAGDYAARHDCVLALEPEPGLCVETTAEVIEFFQQYQPNAALNFDLSHQLVQFENLPQSIRQLQNAGIPLAKIHVSNAAEMPDLKPFYDDSIYLHQVTGADAGGTLRYFSLDWPATPPTGCARYRCHYHLPVFPTDLPSTLPEVEQFLADVPDSIPLIIETYTWPEHMRGRGNLVDNICRELEWVRQKISLSR